MMPKADTIAAIARLNPTANPAFLCQFSNKDLDEYLHRLATVEGSEDRQPVVHQVEIRRITPDKAAIA